MCEIEYDNEYGSSVTEIHAFQNTLHLVIDQCPGPLKRL